MSVQGRIGVRLPRRLVILLFLVTFLAGAAMSLGAMLLERGWRAWGQVPVDARQLVVVRSMDASAFRSLLATQPDVELHSERAAAEVLAELGLPNAGPDLLAVFETVVPLSRGGGSRIDSLVEAGTGVLDVIDLNAADRVRWTPRRAGNSLAAGLLLILFSGFGVVAAVAFAAELAARWCEDEIGTRLWLGADATSLGEALGLDAARAAISGGLLGIFVALVLVAETLSEGLRGPAISWRGSLLLALALIALSLVFARLSARRVVSEMLRTTLGGFALVLSLFGLPAFASSEAGSNPSDWLHAAGVPQGPASQAALVRSLSRDLAVCRRSLHGAEKAARLTGLQAQRARRTDREPLFRLAEIKRAQELDFVERERARCLGLVGQRREAREALRSVRSTDPPVGPRGRPLGGPVVIAWGEGGRSAGTAGFRNAVGLRVAGSEPVRAAARGRIAYVGEIPGSGQVVVIDHGRRAYSVYARIEPLRVRVGQSVALGQPIARVEGGLLHFSVRSRGRAVDPLAWIAGAPRG